jgi:plastocyanin
MWDRAVMRRPGYTARRARAAVSLLAALALAALAAGCGSSSSKSSSTAGENASATTTTGTTPTSGTTNASGSSLKVIGRPEFPTPSASEPVQSGVVQISYRNITAHPVTLRVKPGTTVRFMNYDPIEHNATSEGGPARFASKNFGQGQSFSVKLTRPGVVHFECTLHPATINGSIEVVR